MLSLQMKSGECLTVAGGMVLQIVEEGEAGFRVSLRTPDEEASPPDIHSEEFQRHIQRMAQAVADSFPSMDARQSKEVLGAFLMELSCSLADQQRRERARRLQARGIAVAKEHGVRFGRPKVKLPDNFEEMRQKWRDGELSARQAAAACGMSKTTFYTAANRMDAGRAAQTQQKESTKTSAGAQRTAHKTRGRTRAEDYTPGRGGPRATAAGRQLC